MRFLTTGKLVKLSEKMNRMSEEIDAALAADTRAADVLEGSLHDQLNSLGRKLRPLQ